MRLLVLLAVTAVAVAQEGTQCSKAISDQCPAVDPPVPEIFADPEDCGKFCECSNGIAYEFDCPPGTLFNAEDKQCQTEDVVDCGTRPVDPTQGPGTTTIATTMGTSSMAIIQGN